MKYLREIDVRKEKSMDIQSIISEIVSKYDTRCPMEISEKYNINIRYFPLPEQIRGYSTLALDLHYFVINSNIPKNAKVEVVAELLGNYILYPKNPIFYVTSSYTLPTKEKRNIALFSSMLLLDCIDRVGCEFCDVNKLYQLTTDLELSQNLVHSHLTYCKAIHRLQLNKKKIAH